LVLLECVGFHNKQPIIFTMEKQNELKPRLKEGIKALMDIAMHIQLKEEDIGTHKDIYRQLNNTLDNLE